MLMSLSDGYRANHGENGFLGVTEDGFGVYYREATSQHDERLVILDIVGTTQEEYPLTNGIREALTYVANHYEWAELTERSKNFLSQVRDLDHIHTSTDS